MDLQDGLITCYVMAIPFFKNTLVATIFYSFIFEMIYRIASNEKTYTNTLN